MTQSSAGVPDESLILWAHVIYALHAFSVAVGIATSVAVVSSFLFGLPSIVAVILNYIKRSAVRGTFLESHFRWQIRTFWFAALWITVALLMSLPLMLILIGFATWWGAAALVGLWVLYRVVRGWLNLAARRPMYV